MVNVPVTTKVNPLLTVKFPFTVRSPDMVNMAEFLSIVKAPVAFDPVT